MPRYVKGDHAVETTNAAEGVNLIGRGYARQVARTKAVREADEAAEAAHEAAQKAALAEPASQGEAVKASTPAKPTN